MHVFMLCSIILENMSVVLVDVDLHILVKITNLCFSGCCIGCGEQLPDCPYNHVYCQRPIIVVLVVVVMPVQFRQRGCMTLIDFILSI